VDNHYPLRFAGIFDCLFKGHIDASRCLIVEMQRVKPVGPIRSDRKLKRLIAFGNGVVFAMLKAEDIWTVQAIGPIASDDGTRG
jgi:hypothetical protein